MLSLTTRIGLLAPITWPLPPTAYGAWETVVSNLATGLVTKGYGNVTVFATEAVDIPGVTVVSSLSKPLGMVPQSGARAHEQLHIVKAVTFAREQGLDILHNHFNYQPLLFRDLCQTPMITTLHGSAVEAEAQVGYRAYRSQPFVSISNAERLFLPELNYVATVYNAIDTAAFQVQPTAGTYLVQTARLHPSKGIDQAIFFAQTVGMPLYLAGPIQPGYEWYFEERIKPHLDDQRVIYVGNLEQAELIKLISGAHAFVGLVQEPEAFGLSVVEAMACGTPVIGRNIGAHGETIIDGVTGILVASLEEAVKRFSEVTTIDRTRCAASAAERFSIDAMTNGYLQAYEAVLA